MQAVPQAATAHAQVASRSQIAPALTQRIGETLGLVGGHDRSRADRRVDCDRQPHRWQTLPRYALGVDDRRRFERDDALQEMAQLAHVSWSVIGEQPGLGRLAQALRPHAVGGSILP